MPAKPKHRDPIISSAVNLFRRQGYSSTSVNDIVDACGAPKGSLYHYFPGGKVSIAVEAVERAGNLTAKTLSDLSSGAADTGDLLVAYARLLGGWMRKSGFRDGCPITTILLELAPKERQVSASGRKAYAQRLGVIRDKLIEDGHQAIRAERLAVLSISAIQGALIQSRIDRSDRPLLVAAEELRTLLATLPGE